MAGHSHAHVQAPASRPEPAREGDNAGEPADWQQLLRDRGYRLTPQRELVLSAVNRLGHATPDEILGAVREQSSAVNISTVYRTLELLEELELIRHTHLTDRAPTYHTTATPAHVHLVCRGCGTVLDAHPDEFDAWQASLHQRHGFEADLGHLTVFGRCQECRDD
jgi:Fur family ferric uptake transcriptional regulator